MKNVTRQQGNVELSTDQEVLAQQVFERIKGKLNDELLDAVQAMIVKAPEELFGAGEFELRDRLNQVGVTVLEEAVNAQAKKGVLGC